MEKRNNTTTANLTDLRFKVTEHIIAQNPYKTTDVRSILAETKVGAWRQTDLVQKLKVIFSTS
ncbi:MAG: hypothetical protein PHQ86_09075 [Dehalococcoidales bacterium]|nr:hypothetical protein [Dehalococcoidales bacterium]